MKVLMCILLFCWSVFYLDNVDAMDITAQDYHKNPI